VSADTRTDLVEELMARFAHIPPEAVLKEDLLRTGMAFDESALTDNLEGDVKPKSYFIFSFDQKPLAQLGEAALRRPPEEIALTGGPSVALWGFMAFYVTCVAITWFFYTRRGGLLHDIEHGRSLPPAAPQPAE